LFVYSKGLDSGQTLEFQLEVEVIISDNGSTDQSKEIALWRQQEESKT
jgi:hypothetical protein